MITIAAITMIFLPGTFISAVLSTTFFDYAETGLRVSGKWWVLLVVTVPLTVVVFVIWLLWLRRRQSKDEKEEARKRAMFGQRNLFKNLSKFLDRNDSLLGGATSPCNGEHAKSNFRRKHTNIDKKHHLFSNSDNVA
jgi:hypothetical protein